MRQPLLELVNIFENVLVIMLPMSLSQSLMVVGRNDKNDKL